MQESLNGILIVSLVGRQGAGKTTLAQGLSDALSCPHIEVSSVVAEVCKVTTQKGLIDTHALTEQDPTWLGDAIIQKTVREHPFDTKIVLSGVREKAVHDTLVNNFNAQLFGVVIYCPQIDRLNRQLKSGKCYTVKEFLNRDLDESEMGMEALFPLYPAVLCADSTNPTRVVDQIIELLEGRGAF